MCVCVCIVNVCVCLFLGYKNTNLLLLISYSTCVSSHCVCFVCLWCVFEVLLHYKLQLNYCMTPSLPPLTPSIYESDYLLCICALINVKISNHVILIFLLCLHNFINLYTPLLIY